MTCCLCGGEIEVQFGGWAGGHNPAPVATEEGGRCCSDCNTLKVIPTRLRGLSCGHPHSEVVEGQYVTWCKLCMRARNES